MGERRGLYKVLLGRNGGKKPLGGLSYRWEDNIKMGPKKSDERVWTGLIWLRRGSSGGLL
jgi:hypothetical protein